MHVLQGKSAEWKQLNDDWEYLIDNQFALQVFNQPQVLTVTPPPNTRALCEKCRSLDILSPSLQIDGLLSDFLKRSRACALCKLLSQTFGISEKKERIRLRRDGSALKLHGFTAPFLSICGSQGVEKMAPDIQIGFPELPQAGSRTHFEIVRQWLDNCDKNHSCRTADPGPMPTRVIDVGKQCSETVRLYETKGEKERYVALSHRWGSEKAHPLFCTYSANIDEFKKMIVVDALPKTFRDAVIATRELGVRYLWIDSLCIIQGPDGDWGEQAKCMEEVFSLAYCVIAASCAAGTTDGFLKNRQPRDYATFSRVSGPAVYVCEKIDNFDLDVIRGGLNRRGWVLQERALACRTIHFTQRQTYWECGDGVRCETLTKKTNAKAAILGDSAFPRSAMNVSKGSRIRLYETLYKFYSRLTLTMNEDRPLAIAGLEKRMIRALNVRGGYGIFEGRLPGFESYLGRSLLWERSLDEKAMTKIQFTSTRAIPVPTWSWMAYNGAIDYMDPPFNEVDWEMEELKSPWAHMPQESSWHTGDRTKSVELKAVARGFTGKRGGRLTFDDGRMTPAPESRFVVIGKSKGCGPVAEKTHYVLIVCPRSLKKHEKIWERVGVGAIPGKCIAPKVRGVEVWIH